MLPLFLFNETLSSVLSKTRLFILKFPFEPLKCFKAVEGAVRCFDFCRSEMFHSTRSSCVLICQNFSKVSAFSPKTYLYIFYFPEKGEKKKWGEKNIIISMAPQEEELYPRNEEPRDSSPEVQTFRHLVIPSLACSHTKSRHLLSQALAGTLPPPQVSPGSFGFEFERLQGQAVQQS